MDGEFQQDGTTDIAPAGWPKAIGVLSLIFGILGVTCGVLGLGMLAFFGGAMGNIMSGQLGPNTPPPPFTPPMDAMLIVVSVVGFMLNGLLIFAGVQLMRRRQAGRSLHLVYAVSESLLRSSVHTPVIRVSKPKRPRCKHGSPSTANHQTPPGRSNNRNNNKHSFREPCKSPAY